MRNIHIQLQSIDVNSISGSSGIFIGSNLHSYNSLSSKTNSGITISGHKNQIMKNLSIIKDEKDLEIFAG